MTETTQRIVVSCALGLIGGGALLAEYFGIHVTPWLAVVVILGMMVELVLAFLKQSKKKSLGNKWIIFDVSLAWLILMAVAAYFVGGRPWIVLLLLLIITAADIGAWFFGNKLGGDKMWEKLSTGKTWSGQIAGILCGTFAAVMYGLLGTDTFMPQLLWIGISVSLLSQYGDLTASWIKRKIGIKDFGTLLPGHGGILDRFDGWIYVLPIIWLVML